MNPSKLIVKNERAKVMYGNKCIANKWVRWLDQMWNYPCLVNKGKGFSMQHVFK